MKKDDQINRSGLRTLCSKIENAVNKLDGVEDASVNFMSQKMILEADDEYFDQVLTEAVKIVKKNRTRCYSQTLKGGNIMTKKQKNNLPASYLLPCFSLLAAARCLSVRLWKWQHSFYVMPSSAGTSCGKQ